MAKFLFFSVNSMWAFHFETDLEIMYELMAAGHEVFVLVCGGSLPRCYSNPKHLKLGCMKCVARRNSGLKKIGVPKSNIFTMHMRGINFASIPEEFTDQESLERFELEGVNVGKWVVSTIMKEDEEHAVDVHLNRKKINALLKTSYVAAKNFLWVANKHQFAGVYLLNGRLAEYAPVVGLCKKMNIDFFIHERSGVLNRYFLAKNHLPQELKPIEIEIANLWQAANKDECKRVAEQWFLDRRNAVQQGWLPFTAYQKKAHLPSNWNSSKRNIAIFNGMLAEFFIFDEWRFSAGFNQNRIIENLIESFHDDESYHFYLRVHPNLKDADTTQMRELKEIGAKGCKNLTIIWPEDVVDSYELLESSEKVITFGSTMGVEACFWGKASILWGRASYESLDCVYNTKNFDELCNLVRNEVPLKPREAALPYGYWEMRRGIEFKHYKPTSLSEGKFQGAAVVPEFSFVDKIRLRIEPRISAFVSKMRGGCESE